MTYILEVVHHELLVVDHLLPCASGLGIVRDGEVGLETHLTLCGEGVRDLSIGLTGGRRESLVALEEDLEEDLGVEGEGGRVEGNSLAVEDESVRASDGVRGEEVDQVGGGEASIGHTREDLVDVVLGLGDETQRGGVGRIGTTSKELQARGTRAVRDGDGTGELDKITSGHLELLEKGLKVVDGTINTIVGSCEMP